MNKFLIAVLTLGCIVTLEAEIRHDPVYYAYYTVPYSSAIDLVEYHLLATCSQIISNRIEFIMGWLDEDKICEEVSLFLKKVNTQTSLQLLADLRQFWDGRHKEGLAVAVETLDPHIRSLHDQQILLYLQQLKQCQPNLDKNEKTLSDVEIIELLSKNSRISCGFGYLVCQ